MSYNEALNTLVDEFIANLSKQGEMNALEIAIECEDMGYKVDIDRVNAIQKRNPSILKLNDQNPLLYDIKWNK